MRLKGKKVYLAGYSSKGRAKISAFYGHFVEYGTKKMSARPFMRPAVQRAKGYMKEVLESHISVMNNKLGVS
nr:HK97-gp10 family putative phage morphogenesis protein [uncultured Campylobacter sp.]